MIYPTPKFKLGETTVILNYSYCDATFNDPQVHEQVSPITGYRNYILQGDRSNFVVFVHLEKYDNPKTILALLRSFHGVTVDEFYINQSDTNPVQSQFGGAEKYVCTQVVPIYLIDTKNYSAVILRFDNLKYVQAPEVQFNYLIDNEGNYIVDENGDKIIIF